MPLEENINKTDFIMDTARCKVDENNIIAQQFGDTIPNSELKFITITIRPNVISTPSGKKMTAKRQYLKVIQSLKNYINTLCNDYILIAELTKVGAIHFHALIHITDINQAMLVDSLNSSKFFGNTRIDDIQNQVHLVNTQMYLLKDYIKIFYIVNRICKHQDDLIEIFSVKEYSVKIKINKSLINMISDNAEEMTRNNFAIDFS